MSGPALLLVFSEPGSDLPLAEFTDWYDNEHVPLRMTQFTSFLTGARYHTPAQSGSTTSAQNPGWAAFYDLATSNALEEPAYVHLRNNRSARETSVIEKLDVLDRRTYEVVADSGESGEATSFGVDNPTKWVRTIGFEAHAVPEGWAEKAVAQQRGEEGWIRTRIYRFVEGGKRGVGLSQSEVDQRVPQFLLVHGRFWAPFLSW